MTGHALPQEAKWAYVIYGRLSRANIPVISYLIFIDGEATVTACRYNIVRCDCLRQRIEIFPVERSISLYETKCFHQTINTERLKCT